MHVRKVLLASDLNKCLKKKFTSCWFCSSAPGFLNAVHVSCTVIYNFAVSGDCYPAVCRRFVSVYCFAEALHTSLSNLFTYSASGIQTSSIQTSINYRVYVVTKGKMIYWTNILTAVLYNTGNFNSSVELSIRNKVFITLINVSWLTSKHQLAAAGRADILEILTSHFVILYNFNASSYVTYPVSYTHLERFKTANQRRRYKTHQRPMPCAYATRGK